MVEKDKILIRAAQSGDRAAFGVLVERYQDMVYGICYRMASDPVEAEDLAHDAFVEAFLKIGQLAAPEKFGGWLRTLTLNICRMWYRRRSPATSELVEESVVAPDDEDTQHTRVVWALARLRAEQRLLLVLHYWEGMSYEEVAAFLAVPKGTVMSRLYRARQALKDIVENEHCEEESEMAPDETFGRAIDAELEVLMQAFAERPESAVRLSQILEQDPNRFGVIIAGMNADTLEPLALLLQRLGKEAIEVVLDSAFDGATAIVRTNAMALLRALLASGRADDGADRAFDRHLHEAQEGYWVLERVVQGAWSRQAKVEVLLELAEAGCDEQHKTYPDEGVGTLLLQGLLCYTDEAFPLLMDRFWAADNAKALWNDRWMLYALRRTGPRFCRALLPNLQTDDARLRDLALAGMEVLGEWPDGSWVDEWSVLRRRLEVRFRGKMAPLTSQLMYEDPKLRQQAAAQVARLFDDAAKDTVIRAIAVLSGISLAPYRELIQRQAEAGELPTRLAVLRALTNAGDIESTWLFIEKARSDEAPERRLAVETLGRFQVAEALPLLLELVADKDARVREAAVIALGEIGGDEAEAVLRALISSKEKKLARAAANALYAPPQKSHFRVAEDNEQVQPAWELRKQRLKKVTGDAEPFFYHNLIAAVCVLPELKPYSERDLTYHIGQVDFDYAYTRRHLTVKRIMDRQDSVYCFTELGEAIWRVERFIEANYLR